MYLCLEAIQICQITKAMKFQRNWVVWFEEFDIILLSKPWSQWHGQEWTAVIEYCCRWDIYYIQVLFLLYFYGIWSCIYTFTYSQGLYLWLPWVPVIYRFEKLWNLFDIEARLFVWEIWNISLPKWNIELKTYYWWCHYFNSSSLIICMDVTEKSHVLSTFSIYECRAVPPNVSLASHW